jgi:hypothetical protein
VSGHETSPSSEQDQAGSSVGLPGADEDAQRPEVAEPSASYRAIAELGVSVLACGEVVKKPGIAAGLVFQGSSLIRPGLFAG